MKHLLIAVSLLALAGCATIVNDQKEKIPVRSEPAGATVSVECGTTPVYGGITPAVIIIERTADPCELTIAKEGYAAQKVTLERTVSRAVHGNKVPGAVIGSIFGLIALFNNDDPGDAYTMGSTLGQAPGNAIDRKTGAAYKHVPGEIFVRLDPTP